MSAPAPTQDVDSDMNARTQYDETGYVVLRGAIMPERLAPLQSRAERLGLTNRRADLMSDPEIVSRVDELVRPLFLGLAIPVGRLVELSALVAGNGRSVKLSWHRDRPGPDGAHAFQLPLRPADTFHQLVPGTHRRDLSPEEITARNEGGRAMPGALAIVLDSGDVLLRSPFILHRGFNERGLPRLTLVGTYSQTM